MGTRMRSRPGHRRMWRKHGTWACIKGGDMRTIVCLLTGPCLDRLRPGWWRWPSAGTMMPIPGIGGCRDRSRINRGAARWRRNWGCFRAVRMETWTTTPSLPGRRPLWFWRGPIGCIAMRSMMTRSHCPMPTAG